MQEEIYTGIKDATYKDFKQFMDLEIKQAAEGFVRIGYLLKVARDTEVLTESGYASVADFAKAEYGLTKDMVSRYIAINDKYSKGGYSDCLEERYQGYGVAKLAEMLTLPDEIANEISPDMSKREIREIKNDYKEEQSISDIEVLMEPKQAAGLEKNIDKVLYEHFRSNPDLLGKLQGLKIETFKGKIYKDDAYDLLAPSGMANIRARVSGLGKFMLSINEDGISLLNMRSFEKEALTWDELVESLMIYYIAPDAPMEDAYEAVFGIRPEKQEVAPVQPIVEPQKDEVQEEEHEEEVREEVETEETPESLHDIEPSIPAPNPIEPDTGEDGFSDSKSEESEEDRTTNEQIPGQDSIEQHPEYMPEEVQQAKEDEKTETEGTQAAGEEVVNRVMLQQARNSFSNLKVEMEAKAYKAALASAKYFVHYMELALQEEEE